MTVQSIDILIAGASLWLQSPSGDWLILIASEKRPHKLMNLEFGGYYDVMEQSWG
jgi:hypothetical protein